MALRWLGRCAAVSERPVVELDGSFDGRTVRAAPGDVLVVRLAENRTAGYRWRVVEAGAPVCRLVEDAYEPGGPGLGAAGSRRHAFEVAAPGAARIVLAYGRGWEPA